MNEKRFDYSGNVVADCRRRTCKLFILLAGFEVLFVKVAEAKARLSLERQSRRELQLAGLSSFRRRVYSSASSQLYRVCALNEQHS